jgi:hypothetical protein
MIDVSASPFGGIAERANNFARQDRTLARHLGALSEQEAMDSKLAAAIEAGRVYGIRQQKYDMLLKKQVNQQAKHPLTQPMY